MSILSSTTGHNREDENWVAKILYITIGIAVAIALVTAFLAGHHRQLDPLKKSTRAESFTSPDPAAAPRTDHGP